MTKQTREFLAPKSLKDRFDGLYAMKNFLGIDKTQPASKQSFKAATKLKRELPTGIVMDSIPLLELSSLAEDIHVKSREASQNTNLEMREILGINKAFQIIQGKPANNALKLTEIKGQIKKTAKS